MINVGIVDANGVITNVVAYGENDSIPADGIVRDFPLQIGMTVQECEEDYLTVSMKEQRNLRLKETDWTQSPDSPLTDAKKTEWATYRQALRDITDQEGYPTSITWPVVPN